METKKSKYDTNPLDPDVERKAEESWGQGAPTQQVGGATREVGNSANDNARQNVYSEAPTRRYDNPPLEAPYQSVFVPPTYSPPAQYQRQNVYQAPVSTAPTSRPIPGIGLSEKWAAALPYAPLYIGVVVSLLELFLVPRKEVKVRFHAAQGLALHIAILIVQTIFGVISTITDSSLGGILFKLAAFIFLIISMIRVARGESHRIAPLAEPAQWFNQRIEPRTQGNPR
ncbi:MAG TPA: DUF4870 domain-containing protein [Pyrinomonadaceae bacterium]|nr:DUF4870 domain-containing protein [Pyrinomonadaceae bacterium]